MEEKEKHSNSGHRERMRQRYIQNGLDGFADHEVLEFLLFYCIPRKNTNELAHRILDQFDGKLYAVLDASFEELCRVDGITENTAVLISSLTQVFRRYRESNAEKRAKLSGVEETANYFIPKYTGRLRETVMVACVNSQCSVLNCQILSEGTVDAAPVQIRRIAELAFRCNAYGIVLAHNHPGGVALPSREDIILTHQIAKALDALQIRLIDHVIVAGDDYISMAKNRLFKQNG